MQRLSPNPKLGCRSSPPSSAARCRHMFPISVARHSSPGHALLRCPASRVPVTSVGLCHPNRPCPDPAASCCRIACFRCSMKLRRLSAFAPSFHRLFSALLMCACAGWTGRQRSCRQLPPGTPPAPQPRLPAGRKTQHLRAGYWGLQIPSQIQVRHAGSKLVTLSGGHVPVRNVDAE